MTTAIILGALLLGCFAAFFVQPGWELVLILPPFIACICLGWLLIFQNKAINFRPFQIFFWPHINITSPVHGSRARTALFVAAAFVAGSCLGLLIRVQSA